MAEPASLLCVSCGAAPPPHRRTWGRCTVCVERNLPSTYYCGEECMNAHWCNGHKEYHKEQKWRAQTIREGTGPEVARSLAEVLARRAERTGTEWDKRGAAAMALMAEGDNHGAAKAWRKIIKEWPDEPTPYHNLAITLQQSGRHAEAAPMLLKAMELYEDGIEGWADSAAMAFDLLKNADCDEEPKPEWWNDEALKALSARVVALAPDDINVCTMRARVLSGEALSKAPWNVGMRTAAEIKEAATWYRRGAMVAHTPADKQRHEQHALRCDEFADPLLAEEAAEAAKARAAAKAEASKARAASEAEAAEALKVAEAKATAAAEELLAEEEQEKHIEKQHQRHQASTKAGKSKQSKGKKGKR